MILDEDGNEKDIRLPPYHYKNAMMRTRNQMVTYTYTQQKKIRDLKIKQKDWVVDNRPVGVLYSSDCLSLIEGIGKITQEKVVNYGIKSIGDLAEAGYFVVGEDLKEFCSNKKIGVKKLEYFLKLADEAICSEMPADLDKIR